MRHARNSPCLRATTSRCCMCTSSGSTMTTGCQPSPASCSRWRLPCPCFGCYFRDGTLTVRLCARVCACVCVGARANEKFRSDWCSTHFLQAKTLKKVIAFQRRTPHAARPGLGAQARGVTFCPLFWRAFRCVEQFPTVKCERARRFERSGRSSKTLSRSRRCRSWPAAPTGIGSARPSAPPTSPTPRA